MTPLTERVAKSKAKRQAKRFVFELHGDDDIEYGLSKQLEQLKANKQLKSVIVQALTDYFAKLEHLQK
ncbi:hypothetical protein ACSF86_08645 [Moraxella bovoculi]|uniref:hypothetical protein n=1 Tax=Moraxella bovoculi TaxID=386891 RepID=UPI003F4F8828